MPDGIADEAMAASNENDVWHGCVCVRGVEVVKAISEGVRWVSVEKKKTYIINEW